MTYLLTVMMESGIIVLKIKKLTNGVQSQVDRASVGVLP